MIWAAIAFFLVATLGSLAFLVVRAWRLWRTIRGTGGRTSDAIGRVTASATAAESHAMSLSSNAERLSTSAARLQEALAELAVIRAAAGEPQALLATVRRIVPSK
jgi:hypothetical protein